MKKAKKTTKTNKKTTSRKTPVVPGKELSVIPTVIENVSICECGESCQEDGDSLLKFVTHMEFHGFEIEPEEEGCFCFTAPSGVSGAIDQLINGVELRVVAAPLSKESVALPEILALVNKLNCDAFEARFFIDEQGWFVAESFYRGSYDKRAFSDFLDTWKIDVMAAIDMSFDELNKLYEI
jgi:hypothetical protein